MEEWTRLLEGVVSHTLNVAFRPKDCTLSIIQSALWNVPMPPALPPDNRTSVAFAKFVVFTRWSTMASTIKCPEN